MRIYISPLGAYVFFTKPLIALSRGAMGVYIIDLLSYHHSFNHHIIVCSHPHPSVHYTSFVAVRLYYINVWNSHTLTYHLPPHISQRLPAVYEHIYSYQRLWYSSVLLWLDQGRYSSIKLGKKIWIEQTSNQNTNIWACLTSHFRLYGISHPPPPPSLNMLFTYIMSNMKTHLPTHILLTWGYVKSSFLVSYLFNTNEHFSLKLKPHIHWNWELIAAYIY